jgi:hypothetical protein
VETSDPAQGRYTMKTLICSVALVLLFVAGVSVADAKADGGPFLSLSVNLPAHATDYGNGVIGEIVVVGGCGYAAKTIEVDATFFNPNGETDTQLLYASTVKKCFSISYNTNSITDSSGSSVVDTVGHWEFTAIDTSVANDASLSTDFDVSL